MNIKTSKIATFNKKGVCVCMSSFWSTDFMTHFNLYLNSEKKPIVIVVYSNRNLYLFVIILRVYKNFFLASDNMISNSFVKYPTSEYFLLFYFFLFFLTETAYLLI